MPAFKICDCYNDCTDSSDEHSALCSVYMCDMDIAEIDTQTIRYTDSIGQCYASRLNDQKSGVYNLLSHQICDGVKHCFRGIDELNRRQLTVPYTLRCPREGIVVLFVFVADKIGHCASSNNDELLDYFSHNLAPSCQSKWLSVVCRNPKSNIHVQSLTRSLTLTYRDSSFIFKGLMETLTHLIIQKSNM